MFINEIEAQQKINPARDGMDKDQIKNTVDKFYENTNIDPKDSLKTYQIINALNDGYLILTNIDGHVILGIGLTNNGDLIYICSGNGELRSVPIGSNNVGNGFNYIIKENKPY